MNTSSPQPPLWFPKRILARILNLINEPQPVRMKLKDQIFFEFNLGELIEIDKNDANKINVTLDLGQIGLKTKNNLIGMGGLYYNPKFFGGENSQNVLNSRNWFVKKAQINEETFKEAMEIESVYELLLTGVDVGLLYYFLSLIVDLYALDSLGVNINAKMSELRKQIQGHVRKYNKLGCYNIEAFLRIRDLRLYIADLSSECRLARLAKLYGFDVKLGIHPDMTINGKSLEVKRVRGKYIISKESVTLKTSLSNPVREGLRQGADIVAIEVNNLEKRDLKDFKTVWLGKGTLKNVLGTALTYRGKGSLIMLFASTIEGNFGRMILLK